MRDSTFMGEGRIALLPAQRRARQARAPARAALIRALLLLPVLAAFAAPLLPEGPGRQAALVAGIVWGGAALVVIVGAQLARRLGQAPLSPRSRRVPDIRVGKGLH